MDLSRLAEPFHPGDIEWRVSRSWPKGDRILCTCLAYITARAIANRLDDVCGPENWCNTPQIIQELRPGTYSVQVGISIRINNDEWITKYDVSEPTNIEPAKGGFSGAMKRAGAQWGIGRYLYLLDEEFAETSDDAKKGWGWAKLSDKQGGGAFYWKPPTLPGWALPKTQTSDVPVVPVKEEEVNSLKRRWATTLAKGERNPAELSKGFRTFVFSITGEFPIDSATCWTRDMFTDVYDRLSSTRSASGPSSDVPFG